MSFKLITEQIKGSPDIEENILTDGVRTYLYKDIQNIFYKTDQWFQKKGITHQDCIAFECRNLVPDALLLLYLLHNSYSFLLSPYRGKIDKLSQNKEAFEEHIPQFCRYWLSTELQTKNRQKDIDGAKAEEEKSSPTLDSDPESYLAIKKNNHWKHSESESRPGKLYLRTSGSMGDSKIVGHSHTKLFGNAMNCVKRFQLHRDDRIAISVPIFHMYGLGAAFLPAILAGASIDLQSNANILKCLDRERSFNPNVAFLTPSLCEMFVKSRRGSRFYKSAVTAGDKVKEDVFREFDSRFGSLINLYGSTEMGALATSDPLDPIETRALFTGKPMPGVEIKLQIMNLDSESDIEQKECGNKSSVAQLCCKHEYGFEGYWDEKQTRIGNSSGADWFETGDLATIESNGYIKIMGRCNNSVNRSGFLVLFSDIESAMEKIDNIVKVVVVALEEEGNRGEHIAAFCVKTPNSTVNPAQVKEAAFNLLPNYAIPDKIQIIESIPTLPSGKADRQRLRKIAGINGQELT